MRGVYLSILAIVLSTHAVAGQWEYEVDKDKMSGQVTKTARVVSENSLNLGFPYQGYNFGHLSVRKHPRYGLDVMVSVGKGQILCHAYSNCSVMVKFDAERPVRFTGSPPADHSSEVVFLSGEDGFIRRAKKAKKILVQLPMYQAGEQILEFEVGAPLDWPPK